MSFDDRTACCPFYTRTEPTKICCEGFSEGTRLHICFANKELKVAHKKQYCNDIYRCRLCPLYNVIYKKFRED